VTSRPRAQRAAEYMLRHACRRLPAGIGAERYAEWAAELPAILHDPDIRPAFRRPVRALRYAAGIYRTTRRLPEADGAVPAGYQPAIFPRPDGVLPAIAAVACWLVLLGAARYFPHGGPWMALFIAAAFLPSVLAVIAVARFVRWLRRRPRQP
jgi:hypothetical protein